jgi:hypothetical protein
MRRRFGGAAAAVMGIALAVSMTGCTGFGGSPAPSSSRPAPDPGVPSTAPVEQPTLRPELSASENLAYFDFVNTQLVTANPAAQGRDFIDALVAAGFDKSQMQLTSDETTLGTPADSVQFAVAFQGECLVGQYGPASGGYHGAVRPALGTGGCLIGQTRPIDW